MIRMLLLLLLLLLLELLLLILLLLLPLLQLLMALLLLPFWLLLMLLFCIIKMEKVVEKFKIIDPKFKDIKLDKKKSEKFPDILQALKFHSQSTDFTIKFFKESLVSNCTC